MLPNFLGGLKEYVRLAFKEITAFCEGLCCPHCNGSEIIHYGFYTRKVRTLKEATLIYVKRLYCKSCSRHFSVLPCFIMRYKRYSLDVLEEAYESVVLRSVSVNKSLLAISVGDNIFCPDFSTLYRMWHQIRDISQAAGDNIYTLAKELEPDCRIFSNPVYQQQLDRKTCSLSGKWMKLGLQWITSQMVTNLTSLKMGSGFRPLSLLHFSSVFPTLSPP